MPIRKSAPPVEVPTVLAELLAANPEAKAYFDGLAPSCRREYVGYVTEAKKPETQARRAARTLEMILAEARNRVR